MNISNTVFNNSLLPQAIGFSFSFISDPVKKKVQNDLITTFALNCVVKNTF